MHKRGGLLCEVRLLLLDVADIRFLGRQEKEGGDSLWKADVFMTFGCCVICLGAVVSAQGGLCKGI